MAPVKDGSTSSIWTEIGHFIIHLRFHYQLFILSGGFLMGAYLSPVFVAESFWVQFANVHLLLFGGATAYNSYWDKDEGPVGGLRHPPEMRRWMWPASLLLQFGGLLLALESGGLFGLIYLSSILLFWLYSSPRFRWKGTPIRSLVAIGISTGANSLLMGYLAAGSSGIPFDVWIASVGTALIILSFYPVSQLFQTEEDCRRGDVTFAVRFGMRGVMTFFRLAFSLGVLLLGIVIMQLNFWLGAAFIAVGMVTGYWVDRQLAGLMASADAYLQVMRIKYGASMAFVAFIVVILVFRHGL